MDLISRQAVRLIESDSDAYPQEWNNDYEVGFTDALNKVLALPSVQPQYEELTPEEVASELASGSTMSVWYWLDDMIRLKQMGYAICRKENR